MRRVTRTSEEPRTDNDAPAARSRFLGRYFLSDSV
jgi:hypothetical protein